MSVASTAQLERYTDRESKAVWLAARFAPILGGSVLDVGCDAAPLRTHVGDPSRYVGVDIRPDADVVVNLDSDDLPFEPESFDTVVCTDVLEHLSRTHDVFDQICHIAAGHILISLPNPLRNLVLEIQSGSLGNLKYYGLPTDPPADRHQWFFGHDDAVRFVTQRGARLGFEVEHLEWEDDWAGALYDAEGRNLLDHQNFQRGTMWCVLHRQSGAAS